MCNHFFKGKQHCSDTRLHLIPEQQKENVFCLKQGYKIYKFMLESMAVSVCPIDCNTE